VIPVFAWIAAVGVGVSLGMLGSGGSILTVPLLHATAGLSVPQAEATSLPVVGLIALSGFLGHWRRGAVGLREALPFCAASLLSAFVASRWLSPLLSHRAHVVAFGALMVVVAARMAFAAGPGEDAVRARRPTAAVLAVGCLVGVLTGVLGVGGGFVIVPALVLMLAFDVRAAVATSLVVIAVNCAGGLLGRLAAGGESGVDWALVAVFAGFGVVGAEVGGRVAHRANPRTLRRVFAVVVLAMAAYLLGGEFA
jgi:uncharacterized membrane protein YfcA